MKRYGIISILFLISTSVFPTWQAGDILIYEGKEYQLLDTPLEAYPEIASMREKFFGDKDGGYSTGCWRGYIAEWVVEEGTVFLTNIYSYNYFAEGDSLKSDLKELFGDKCVDGRVKADWISKELLVADGKLVMYFNDGFQRFYAKEKGFFIEDGNLVEVVDYDNSKMKKSEYSDNSRKMIRFIYSNIQWDSLPDVTDERVRVIVTFRSGETENPENITVIRGSSNPLFDEEAKRVISLLKWNVYYKRGKPVRIGYTIPVVFSKENKAKFSSR